MSYRSQLGISRRTLGSYRPHDGARFAATCMQSLAASLEGTGFRPHQKEAIRAFSGHFRPGHNTGYAVIPTGGGKTRIFMGLVAATRNVAQGGMTLMPTTIVLVPTKTLIAQTLDQLSAHHPEVETGHISSSTLVGKDGKPFNEGAAPVTLMTYAGFMKMAEEGLITPDDVDHLIMDEAHRGLSDMRQGVVQAFREEGRTLVTAFTATPAYDEVRALGVLLGNDNEVIRISHERLRDEGFLAPLDNYLLSIKFEGVMPSDRTRRVLTKRAFLVDESLSFIEHLRSTTHPEILDRVTVFYGSDCDHAALFAERFNRIYGRQGKLMLTVTGNDSPEYLRNALRGLETGRINGVSNSKLLTEGWDLPSIGLVIGAPTSSLVDELQRGGRAMRPDPSRPSDAQTVTVVNTYYSVNGRIEGKPRYLGEALGDMSAVHCVEGQAVDPSKVDLTGSRVTEGADLSDESEPPSLQPMAVSDQPCASCEEDATESGFEASHDMVMLMRFIARRDGLPPKDESWLSCSDFRNLYGFGSKCPHVNAAWAGLVSRCDGHVSMHESRQVRFEYRRSSSATVPVIHRDDAAAVASTVSRLRASEMINDDLLQVKDVAKLLNLAINNRKLRETWEALKSSFDGENARVGDSVFACKIAKSSNSKAFTVHRSHLPKLAELTQADLAPAPHKTAEWLSYAECAAQLNTATKRGFAFNALWEELSGERGTRHGIQLQLREIRHKAKLCIHKDDVRKVAAILGIDLGIEKRTKDWLGPTELAPIFSVNIDFIKNKINEMQGDSAAMRIMDCQLKRTVVGIFPYIHESKLNEFSQYIKIPIGGRASSDANWLSFFDIGAGIGMSRLNGTLRKIGAEVAEKASWEPKRIQVLGVWATVALRRNHSRVIACVLNDDASAIAERIRSLAHPRTKIDRHVPPLEGGSPIDQMSSILM